MKTQAKSRLLSSRALTWGAMVLGVVMAGAGSAALWMDRDPADEPDAFTASELVTLRFPDGWENEPIRRPEALLVMAKGAPTTAPGQLDEPRQTLARMSTGDFALALQGLDQTNPRRAQPANALFNDLQIAGIKARLGLTPDQERHWPPLEEALRGVAWKQTGGRNGPVLDTAAAERLKQAAGTFLAVLNERQKRDIKLLANVGGLKLDL